MTNSSSNKIISYRDDNGITTVSADLPTFWQIKISRLNCDFRMIKLIDILYLFFVNTVLVFFRKILWV
jgi:hypothetical protein